MPRWNLLEVYSARIFRLADCIWCGPDCWDVCFILLAWCIMWYINMTWVRDNMLQQNEFRAGIWWNNEMLALFQLRFQVIWDISNVTLILMAANINYYANKVTSWILCKKHAYWNIVHHCEINCSISCRFFATRCYVMSILSVSKLDQLQIIRE